MPTTTNFGWTTPADTDLVKDGAAAIRTLGSNIDTSLVDLKGGTSGQYLKKNSNTDLDYVWGDVSAGGMTLISTTSLSGATTSISGIPSGYNSITLFIYGATNATSDGQFRCAPNNLTNITTNVRFSTTGQYTASGGTDAVTYLYLTVDGLNRTNANNAFTLTIDNYANSSFQKTFFMYGGYRDTSAPDAGRIVTGTIATTSAITSLVFSNSGGDLSTGTVLLYGVK